MVAGYKPIKCWRTWARNDAFGWLIQGLVSGRDQIASWALWLLWVLGQRFFSLISRVEPLLFVSQGQMVMGTAGGCLRSGFKFSSIWWEFWVYQIENTSWGAGSIAEWLSLCTRFSCLGFACWDPGPTCCSSSYAVMASHTEELEWLTTGALGRKKKKKGGRLVRDISLGPIFLKKRKAPCPLAVTLYYS